MSQTLQTIQKLSKLGKILCQVFFVLSIIGAVGCVIGIIGVASIPGDLMLDGTTINDMLLTEVGVTINTLYAILAAAIVLCIGEAVVCKFSEKYFRNELQAGTPFTFAGAKEMFRLGIIAICVTIGSSILASIVYAIIAASLGDVVPYDFYGISAALSGVAFLVLSVIFKYGAEQAEKAGTTDANTLDEATDSEEEKQEDNSIDSNYYDPSDYEVKD